MSNESMSNEVLLPGLESYRERLDKVTESFQHIDAEAWHAITITLTPEQQAKLEKQTELDVRMLGIAIEDLEDLDNELFLDAIPTFV